MFVILLISLFIIQNLMETMTGKTDQQSSVAELQEKIGIFLTFFLLYKWSGFFGYIPFLSLHYCPVFPQVEEDGEVDINASSYSIPSIGDLKC